jgi:hypothetical protein
VSCSYFHQFLPRAAAAADPVERMKNVVAAMVSAMTLTSGNFLKPLNPILGETLQVLQTIQLCSTKTGLSYHISEENPLRLRAF